MAASTITLLSNSLRRSYAERFFKALQSAHAPFLDELDECPDDPTLGSGWFCPIYMSTPQNWHLSAEGDDMRATAQRVERQIQVNAKEFYGYFQITEMLKNAGVKSGAWNGGELARSMEETTGDITKGMQRIFSISHGTGRLAVVDTTTSSSNSFNARNNEGVNALMEGDEIEFYNLDSGGAIQAGGASPIVTAISRVASGGGGVAPGYGGTVTFDGSALSLTAGWGVYKAGSYGNAPNGLHGTVDDGTFNDDYFGLSRASFPKLKCVVQSAGNGTGTANAPADLTEDDLRSVCDLIYLNGGSVDRISCNVGMMNQLAELQTGDRRYNIVNGNTPKYVLGFKEGDLLFSYDRGDIVIRKNPNLPNRTIYFYSLKTGFYKHTLRKLGFLDEGGSILRPTPGTNGYRTSWTAQIVSQCAISGYTPSWQGRLQHAKDRRAGDTIV